MKTMNTIIKTIRLVGREPTAIRVSCWEQTTPLGRLTVIT